jgi:polar amino acid transport system substrate-binding protein
MRKALLALALTTLVLAFAATATGEPAAPAAIPGCAPSSLNLLEDGTLTLGTDNPAFPPWWGGTPKSPWKTSYPYSGKGYESAVAYGIAKRLGFARSAVKWTVLPYLKSFAPGKKSFDFYLAQISFTPVRAKTATFSSSYYDVNQAVVALKGKPIAKVKTVAGLKPYKFGVPLGTTSYSYVVGNIKPSQKPAVYDTLNDAVTALKNGQIDGLVVDFPSTGYITGVQVPNSVVVGRLPTKGKQEHFGLVFAKGNPLVACVNKALAAMKRDGTLKRLERQWLAGSAPLLK